MYGILVSAFNFILGWIFRAVVVKFIIMTAVFYIVTEIFNAVVSKLDITPLTNLQSSLNTLPAGLLYYFGVFRLDVGIPMVLSAYLVAFLIRRIPFIG